MSETAPKDPTTAFAEELAKQLPVKAIYRDAVKPAARQVGQIAQDIIKTIQLALAPLQVAGAYQDRLRAFLDRAVRQVPEDRRISPPPQILGPIVEGIRYEPEDTSIDEMFRHLLSNSMDAEHSKDAHPAYPLLIKQLSSDEAKILQSLKNAQFEYVHTEDYDQQTNLFHGHKIEIDNLPRDGLFYPENVAFYMQHLDKLGLAGVYQDGNQEPLFLPGTRNQIGIRQRSKYRLTPFGDAFMRACSSIVDATVA
jgi:hypothetical protein